jgi:hypothetical protein
VTKAVEHLQVACNKIHIDPRCTGCNFNMRLHDVDTCCAALATALQPDMSMAIYRAHRDHLKT